MSSVAYIMQWGDHKTNVHNHLRVLFEEQKFVDLTLFCSTHSVKVHSIVIASNSSYFEKVLLSQNGVNSVIVLKDMKFEVLRALIEFMYCGETTVLDEDVDALLYASKKFEVKGLSRMTRQGVMISAEKTDNETAEPNHRFIFPAESAQPGMIQAVLDLTKNQLETTDKENKNLDSLYFKNTVFQKRGRPNKKHGNFGFSEAAMSDTEYAILKEAEESRKALEKLQKYVLSPNGIVDGTTGSQSKLGEPFLLNNSNEESKAEDHSYWNSRHVMEDEIAAENLSNELNQQNQNELFESTVLPTDIPIFVDDGNGNYVTLDVEMANMIAGQEYNLVQGVVMTSDGKVLQNSSSKSMELQGTTIQNPLLLPGSQHSNPASILIPENHFQPAKSMPILVSNEENNDQAQNFHLDTEKPIRKMKTLGEGSNEITSTTDSTSATKRKPFVVKEIVKLKQPKKNSESVKMSEIKKAGEDANSIVQLESCFNRI